MIAGMFSSRMQDILQKPETPYMMSSFDEGMFLLSKVSRCTESYVVPKEGQIYPAITSAVKEMCTILDHGFLQSELDRRRASFLSSIDLSIRTATSARTLLSYRSVWTTSWRTNLLSPSRTR